MKPLPLLLLFTGCIPIRFTPMAESNPDTVYLPPPYTVEMRIETRSEREVLMEEIKRELERTK